MSVVIQGIVRGGKIELIDGPALADGQRVQVVVEAPPPREEPAPAGPTPEEGVIHTPASPELLAFLEQLRRRRRPLPPSPTGPGRRSSAGMLADDPDFDAVMAEIERERRADFGREVEG
jgi:hypothetical protein